MRYPSKKYEPILMKLYTVVVYHMRMCRKKDNPGIIYKSWEINIVLDRGYPL